MSRQTEPRIGRREWLKLSGSLAGLAALLAVTSGCGPEKVKEVQTQVADPKFDEERKKAMATQGKGVEGMGSNQNMPKANK
jgi:hypothetical protein